MNRDWLMARVVSGVARVKVGGLAFYFATPTPGQLYEAEEVYLEEMDRDEQSMTGEELLSFLLENGHWDGDRQSRLDKLPGLIEDAKVAIFESAFRSHDRAGFRRELEGLRGEENALSSQLHRHDGLTKSGSAGMVKTRFLAACTLRHRNGSPAFPEGRYLDSEADLLDAAMAEMAGTRPGEKQLRDLARNEPWRSVWCCKKSGDSLFGVPAVTYTQEQRSLVAYSCLYDSVYEHPQCPDDATVNDDDCLDGWLIVQRRSRGQAGPDIKVRDDAQEVFVPCQTAEDAKRLMARNSPQARATIRQRQELADRHGSVDMTDLPDVRQRFRQEAARAGR